MTLFRRISAIAILALSVSVGAFAPVRAQVGPMPVIDLSAIKQAISQLQQLQNTYNQTVNIATNTMNQYQQLLIAGRTLNPTQLNTMTNLLNAMQALPGIQTQISSVNTQVIKNFEQSYPTYQPNANYPKVLQTLNDNTNASLSDAYSQVQAQNANITSEQTYLATLLSNANSATGQMQALQTANQFLSMLNEQMEKLRQIQLAMLRNQTAFIKNQMAQYANSGSGGSGGVTNTHTQDTAVLYWLSQSGLSASAPPTSSTPAPTPSATP